MLLIYYYNVITIINELFNETDLICLDLFHDGASIHESAEYYFAISKTIKEDFFSQFNYIY